MPSGKAMLSWIEPRPFPFFTGPSSPDELTLVSGQENEASGDA